MSENKYCIFNYNKLCNNCGECDRCDIDPNKKCNNCGKCLEDEGYDMKAIEIDKVVLDGEKLDTNKNSKDSEKIAKPLAQNSDDECECQNEKVHADEEAENSNDNIQDDVDSIDNWKPNVEYIDDVEGLNDLLKDVKKLDEVAFEEFPGLIRFKNKRYKN